MKNAYETADIAIIGAGVVGCAIARHLSIQYPGKKIIVLEKLLGVAQETSGLNSGVLHSGIHQNPDFLKSKLAQEGSKMAAEYHINRKMPILSCGMIVAIPFPWEALRGGLWKEWDSLFHLIKRGLKQKIKFRFLTPWGLRKMEPSMRALGGIFIPDVWVIDPVRFVKALQRDAKKNGARFFFNREVTGIQTESGQYAILTHCERFIAKLVINAAGLYADEIAKLAGFPNYKIYPWRGEYYEIINNKQNLARHLIYPATSKKSPSKGVHLGPRVDGRLFIGPNALPVPSKNYYTQDKTPVEFFLKAAQKFFPQIKKEDLRWAYSGIRPKLTNQSGEDDFLIKLERQCPPFLNLVGIESPGLASSMAIGKYVAQLVKECIQ